MYNCERIKTHKIMRLSGESLFYEIFHQLLYGGDLLKVSPENRLGEWYTYKYASGLDYNYFFVNSGEKYLSNSFIKFLKWTDKTLNLYPEDDYIRIKEGSWLRIVALVLNKFGAKWNRIYETYFNSEYNPINNYNIKETQKVNSKITTANNGTAKTDYEDNQTAENTDNIFGFNSTTARPSDNSNGSSRTNGNQTNSNENTEVITREADDNYTTKDRSGNIGTTTSQKLLEEELELRKFNFMNMIFKDVDSILCSKLY